MPDTYSTTALIMAAGSSKRFGQNKLMAKIQIKPVIVHTLESFDKSSFISAVIVVTSENIKSNLAELITNYNIKKVKNIILGGKTRQESVKNGLDFLKNNDLKCSFVAVHDGARPLINGKDIDKCVQGAVRNRACALGIRPKDTIKKSDSPFSKTIIETIPRELLWAIQTPQVFEYDLIYEAHQIAQKDNFQTTDDCSLVERIGIKPVIIDSSYKNIKITTPEDLSIAEVLINEKT